MVTALAAALLASLLTVAILYLLRGHREVAAHDRRLGELNEDLRRWVRDRHQRRAAELNRITSETAARGLLYSGSLRSSLKIAAEQAREEWRNELSSKLREFTASGGDEGRLHELIRRRRGNRPVLELPEDVRGKLKQWRTPMEVPGAKGDPPIAIEDPMAPELEPELAKFERVGRRELPPISLLTGAPRSTLGNDE